MEVLFREGVLDGGAGTIPEGMDWEEARAAGVRPTMAFLGRDEFFLAVASEDVAADGRVDHVALEVDDATFEAVTERAEHRGFAVERNADHHRVFEDHLGFEWELNAKPRPPGRAFEPFDL